MTKQIDFWKGLMPQRDQKNYQKNEKKNRTEP
jgi:hypothetical protein